MLTQPPSDRLHRQFINVYLVPPSRTDLKIWFTRLLFTGCQYLNRSLSRLRVNLPLSFVRFSAGSIMPLNCSFRHSPQRCSTLRLEFDYGEVPQLALRYTPNQAFSDGWSTAKDLDSLISTKAGTQFRRILRSHR